MRESVEFYYDFASPYCYLVSTQIEAICKKYNAAVEWKPFLLGGVFKETGNHSPILIPSKKTYIVEDLGDWARHYGVEFDFPALYPVQSLRAMRGALAAIEKRKIRDYTHKLFRLYWVQGKDLSQDEVLKRAVCEIGMDADWFLSRIAEQDIKDKLREETAKAVKRGAFGAPTVFIGDKMFWGNDRLTFVEEYLKRNL